MKLLRTTSAVLLTLLFLGTQSLKAQENTEIIQVDIEAEITEINESIIPSLQTIISALEAQNAPVPAELSELKRQGKELETAEDILEFGMQAERYFGDNWEQRILDDAEAQADPESILFVRTRIYVSSLISHADEIAKFSPLSAEDIRAYGIDLMQKSSVISSLDQKAFSKEFADTYNEIFPQSDEEDLETFRDEVTLLLADLADALSILTSGRTYESLRADLAELQSHLQLVSDSQQLTSWLARFDAFAEDILKHTVPTDRAILTEDISALLDNLSSYITSLQEAEIATGHMQEAVFDLKEELKTIETDEELDDFLDDLEDVLTNVTNS